MQSVTRYRSTLLLGAALALGACSKADSTADSAAAVAASDSMAMMKNDSTAMGAGAMSAANIAAAVGMTNMNEINAGKLAQDKATNADVKAFAKQMVDEHQMMQSQLDSLSQAKGIVPQPPQPMAEEMTKMADQTTTMLNEKAKGAEYDRAYIESQVAGHQKAVNDLQAFSNSATDPDLKALIDAAIPKVQGHLDKAQQIQASLAKM